MRSLQAIVVFLSFVALGSAMTDKATGIAFSKTSNNLALFGVGVRKKGPIKVYSVAAYCQGALKDKLRGLSDSQALEYLKEGPTTFCIEMAFKVGAEKMASAIAEAVKGSPSEVDALKAKIFEGLQAKGSATKGTTLQFDCDEGGVGVTVDGKPQGKVGSESLSKAFCEVYLGKQAVAPTLVTSILENI